MSDLSFATVEVLAIQPAHPAVQQLWSNLTQTFAVAMCPKRLRQHTARIHRYLANIHHPGQPEFVLLADSVATLYQSQGRTRIEEIALAAGVSRRHLERQFNQALGLTPKRLARLIRFEAVRDQLLHDPLYRLTELPFEFGFTDQAHFIHDFKSLSALTPGEFVGLVLRGDAADDGSSSDGNYCKITRDCPLYSQGADND